MLNYHPDLVWDIDKALIALTIFLAIAVIAYSLLKELLLSRRNSRLDSIKNDMGLLMLLRQGASKDFYSRLFTGYTSSQFIDMVKDKTLLLNEELEQKFKESFISSDKKSQIEKIARHSRNKWRRIDSIILLAYANTPSALEIISRSIFDKDEDVSYFSMLALSRIKTKESARILLDFMGKHIFSAYKIASILETFPPAIADEVVKATENPDETVRVWALKVISRLRPAHLAGRIQGLTVDASSEVRAAACECLGELGQPSAQDAILACLKDQVWVVRMYAVKALEKILGKESIPFIINLIADDSLGVRTHVKEAASRHIDIALPYIEEFMSDADKQVKKECVEVLENSGYVATIFNNAFSEDAQAGSRAIALLEKMIGLGAHLGLEDAMNKLEPDRFRKILAIIAGIDRNLAEHIEKKLNRLIEEV